MFVTIFFQIRIKKQHCFALLSVCHLKVTGNTPDVGGAIVQTAPLLTDIISSSNTLKYSYA